MIFLGTPPERPNPWIEIFRTNPPPATLNVTYEALSGLTDWYSGRPESKQRKMTKPPIVWMRDRLLYGELHGAFVTGGYAAPKVRTRWGGMTIPAVRGW